MLAPARICMHGVCACVSSCLCERDLEYLRLRASVCVRPRALMSVFVCAHARVYVYVQVYVRDSTREPARMCECIRARMRSCVNVCRVIVRSRVHTRVFVRACRGLRV